MSKELEEKCAALTRYLREAGQRYLLPLLNKASSSIKADGSLVTEADLAVNRYLTEKLRRYWPEIPVLSEETTEQAQRQALNFTDSGVWCIDPLDGTSNFSCGAPYFAISVAYIIGGELKAAAVYDPVRDEMFHALSAAGAWLNGCRLEPAAEPAALDKAIANIDFKRLPAALGCRLLEDPVYSSQRNYGACALELCWLAARRFHVYLHGGMKLWDYAAGGLVLSEAGGVASDLDGRMLIRIPGGLQTSVVAAVSPVLYRQWYDHVVGLGCKDQ